MNTLPKPDEERVFVEPRWPIALAVGTVVGLVMARAVNVFS